MRGSPVVKKGQGTSKQGPPPPVETVRQSGSLVLAEVPNDSFTAKRQGNSALEQLRTDFGLFLFL